MTPDIQKSILRACARFIAKSLEPIQKRLTDMENKSMEVPLDGVVKELLSADEMKTLVDLHVAEAVTKHFEANPVKHGDPGQPGKPGENGKSISLDDVSLILEAAIARHVLELERRATDTIAKAIEKIPVPVNGKDGIDFDQISGEFDPDRGFVIRMANGDRSTEFVLPYMRHGGFWSEGKAVGAGVSMTHDGALWIAKRVTKAKPCAENGEDWILAARKGRDGRDGRNGIDKTVPVKVNGNG